ncbi:hypothetical protein Lyticum_00279 [Lyticum sinuosum]|uniref:Uncharacterized protein n=1 Tax=Lyticum sinuosum TaxID=1332059 RepID=A0AAE4VKT3_9RICK|nr:hypothetical protein [Lyticum sinuosum]
MYFYIFKLLYNKYDKIYDIFNINSYKDYNKIFTKSYIQNSTVNEAIYDIEVAENSLEKEIIQYKFKVNNKNNFILYNNYFI